MKVVWLDYFVIYERGFLKILGNCILCYLYGVLCFVLILLLNIFFILFFLGVVFKLDYIKDFGVGVILLSFDYEDDGIDGDFYIKNYMKIVGFVGGDDVL